MLLPLFSVFCGVPDSTSFPFRSGTKQCKRCPKGMYTDSNEESSCKVCPGGRFSNELGANVCRECDAGMFNGDKGAVALKHHECDHCPAALVSKAGALFCFNCPVGRHNTSNLTMPCRHCPAGFLSQIVGQGDASWNACRKCKFSLVLLTSTALLQL